MMSYGNGAVKKYGEVFTPAGIVFEMIMSVERKNFEDADKQIFDPCAGEGHFSCAELVLKLFCNLENLNEETALRALNSLYAMDIQPENIAKTRKHLLETLKAAYKFFTGEEFTQIYWAKFILEKNIRWGNSLEFMEETAETKKGKQFSLAGFK